MSDDQAKTVEQLTTEEVGKMLDRVGRPDRPSPESVEHVVSPPPDGDTTLQLWSVWSEGGQKTIWAHKWECNTSGLKFFRDGEIIAWFTSWSWFQKRDKYAKEEKGKPMPTPNTFNV